ncbi:DUF6286 domain-containing protein [Amycolatopsis acidiphila]|uniref:DUF6286 domain-containing protein n=1 Tax=Amycolatopsis acidiphila TaxID=715473 RepID=A0A558AAR5_9PSEU|nr:DUF6286 domain-containing protein [Amycolatopsis acidiphila]TVT21358.1 hypothetical protein FNH06_17485 [Amycolatopsis acidiphila]UIJ63576.1 DUF6286 domain-containing protein [Amycolatopsis acidiphila]GHG68152.1 hypothetical protein GCM10017788_27570 [Amycolatopsis acidiphila]
MIRRSRRSLAATVVALVGLAACALVATSAIQLLLHKTPVLDYTRAANAAHDTNWSELPVVIGGAVLAALGLALLLPAVLPGRPLVLPLRETGAPLISGAGTRGMAAVLRSAAESVEGVAAVKLKLRRKTVTARVDAGRLAPEDLGEQVRAALEDQLGRIDPATRPHVRVHIGGTS